MKKIITLLAVIGMFGFQGCTGPEGPPGIPGQDGADGLLGVVYENTSANYYNFTANNNFKVRFNFPVNATLYDSDVVLVYRLGGVDNGKAVWEFLPETRYFDDGTRDFSFNFNFTYNYVDIYLSGNDLGTVPSEFSMQQIFRIVVVPADFAASVNKASYLDVVSKLNIKESQIQQIKL
ncbi:MAG TPA: hypothetical protein VFS71_01950 [Flavobacterium sp.]|uniref:hypothetical protein n=1 Tax=Flavobacterium sp. TaxID=239 RepID=UPI002DBB79BD|nr:hypothetical protein [Flavobacterium sp.]HEU4788422.1 hypothetical protein [Flavobacterium sp.]